MKFKDIAPLTVFVCFICLFIFALNSPSPSIPKTNVNIDFSTLPIHSIDTGAPITFPTNQLYIVNVFSSWCQSCKLENKQLLEFSALRPDIPIYGLLWMDSTDNGKGFLKTMGNPYKEVAAITDFEAINLGVTGIPEIFIVGNNNKVLYHIRGGISAKRLNYAIQQADRGA